MVKHGFIMTIDDIVIEVFQKDIRSLRLTVRPPHGEVRISVPHRMDEGTVRRFLTSKIDWIRKHQTRMRLQQWNAPPQCVTGEKHSFLGKEYELRVCTGAARSTVTVSGEVMELHLRRRSSRSRRMALLDEWYRDQLRKIVPAMIERYEHLMHVSVAEWRTKKMKSKWGTCNITMRRIWLNLELAKKTAARH